MLYSIFIYLFKSSFSLFVLVSVYYLILRRLTFFSWMRYYLLASIIVSLILPLLNIPAWNTYLFSANSNFEFSPIYTVVTQNMNVSGNQNEAVQIAGNYTSHSIILGLLFCIYTVGLILKSYSFYKKNKTISKFIKENRKTKKNNIWIVHHNQEVPTFSFFNYVFINNSFNSLSENNRNTIFSHELVHVKQFHTLDIFFVELISIVYWFNPLIIYIEKVLKELHEYIADEKIILQGENIKNYSELLLSLTSNKKLLNLSAGFAGLQITRRVKMITKPRSLSIKKYFFLIIVPITTVLLMSFSSNDANNNMYGNSFDNQIHNNDKVGNIIWEENHIFQNDVLDKAFGVKSGDEYDAEKIGRILNKNIGDLYFEKGYLFFNGKIIEHRKNGIVDLEIQIFEGNKGQIGETTVNGNKTISEKTILKNMKLEKGDLFSRKRLNDSVLAIRKIKGVADNSTIEVVPNLDYLTKEGYYIIDLEIEITEN